MDNAEVLRMIRKLNGDVWLLLSCILGVLVVVLTTQQDCERGQESAASRLTRLELWRLRLDEAKYAASQSAQPADRPEPSDAVPAVKRAARKTTSHRAVK
jgi:hypothetical protein